MYQMLIVDDEYELRNGIASYFPWHELGFSVAAVCSDGLEALQIIDKQHIDVVLSDIVMPNMDGLTLAAEIRARKLPTRIFFLSAYPEFKYAQRAMELGVKQFIVKPTRYNDLKVLFSALKTELDNERLEAGDLEVLSDGAGKTYYDDVIITVMKFIDDNLQDVTLEAAARQVFLSPYYLSNLFKLRTGIKFSDCVQKKRMKKAAEMLSERRERILDISVAVGYSNPNNFARAFKHFYGVSPREYRLLSGGPRADRADGEE